MVWSGIIPTGTKSTIGRYFCESGIGLGGTKIINAKDAVASIDTAVARVGGTLLVTDTTGETANYFIITKNGVLEEIPVPESAQQVVDLIHNNCEESRVSAVLMAGVGGSARAGVTKRPIMLTKAIHSGTVNLTSAGNPVFLLPGGGITFGVDLEKIPVGSITWVPTPALVVPLEYTMLREVYVEIGGHLDCVKQVQEVIRGRDIRRLSEMDWGRRSQR
jgi:hypothetical protein